MQKNLEQLRTDYSKMILEREKNHSFQLDTLNFLLGNDRISNTLYKEAIEDVAVFLELIVLSDLKELVEQQILVRFNELSALEKKGVLTQAELGQKVLDMLLEFGLISNDQHKEAIVGQLSHLRLMEQFKIPYDVWGTRLPAF